MISIAGCGDDKRKNDTFLNGSVFLCILQSRKSNTLLFFHSCQVSNTVTDKMTIANPDKLERIAVKAPIHREKMPIIIKLRVLVPWRQEYFDK